MAEPTANPSFTGSVALPGGGCSLRRPVNGGAVVDGNTARTLPGDKVAYAFSSKFCGGFVGDTGGNPTFAWGANDFCTTGKTPGDVDGLDNLTARETELHLYTPGATVGNLKGLQVDCKVEASAVGAVVRTMFGVYVSPVSKDAGTVGTAFGVYIEAPTAGDTNEALHVVGATSLVGALSVNGAVQIKGDLSHSNGKALFNGPNGAGNKQGSPAGVYVGNLGGGSYGVNLSDGSTTWGIDTTGGKLRFMQAAVKQAAALDVAGNLTLAGGLAFRPPTTSTPPAGSPTGYMTVNVNGADRQVAYY